MKRIAAFFITIVFALSVPAVLLSQEVSPVDFMRINPNNAASNAAANSAYFGYFGMGFGNLKGNLYNSGVFYDDVFRFDAEGYPVAVNMNNINSKLKDVNKLCGDASFDIFNCGRQLQTGFFTFSYRFRAKGGYAFPKDFIKLLAEGNSAFMGEDHPANIDMEVNAKAFSELNFGYQLNVNEKLSLGARVKFLMGFANARSQKLHMQLFTDPETYVLRLNDQIDMDICSPNAFTFENGRFKFTDGHFHIGSLFRNPGLGIDLGVDYKIDERFGVAAAVNDLGFIVWKRNAMHIKGSPQNAGSMYQEGSVVFDGFDPHQLRLLINDKEYRQKYLDTVSQYLGLEGQAKKYVTGLNANMSLRGYYDINADHRVTAQLQGWFTGIDFDPAFTLAYNATFMDMFDLVATYTATPYCYTNLGIGLGFHFYHFYLFGVTNNVISVFNPMNAKQFGVQVGLVFTSDKVNQKKVVMGDDVQEFNW